MSKVKDDTLSILKRYIRDIGVNQEDQEEISEAFRRSEEEWNAQRRKELGLSDDDEYENEY